jgi:DNA-binding CsgD family transcriptional regulator
MKSIDVQDRTATLTSRETDLVRELLSAAANKEIAFRLGLTVGTVKVYFTKLANKLNVPNRVALALWAERSGLFSRRAPDTDAVLNNKSVPGASQERFASESNVSVPTWANTNRP